MTNCRISGIIFLFLTISLKGVPNLIFILVDDLGWGDMGSFYQDERAVIGDRSEPWFDTPALDRMAAEGARLTDHYAPAPVCAPSRASLLTGIHQGHASVRNNQFDEFLEETHTLGSVLSAAGYQTVAVGKWGLAGGGASSPPEAWHSHPLKRGFSRFFGYIHHRDGHEHYPKNGPLQRVQPVVWDDHTDLTQQLDKCYTTDLFTAWSKKWITEHVQTMADTPFFMYLAFDTPHAQTSIPTQGYPEGGGLNGGLQWLGTPGHMINTASGEIDSWIHPDYRSTTWDNDDNPSTPEVPWPDVYRRYATMVRRIDSCVADLVQLLNDLGIGQDTLVVFSSDNGPSMESYLEEEFSPEFFNGFGPMEGIKRDVFEGGIRVPTIAWWPGNIPASSIVTAPSAFWDWMPTFAEVAGVPAPAVSDGLSLLPVLTGSTDSLPERILYFEYFHRGNTPAYEEFQAERRGRLRKEMQALRKGNLMAVRYNIQSAEDEFEIFDVVNDPAQHVDLGKRDGSKHLQEELKASVLQMRKPHPQHVRPYDNIPVPKVDTPRTETIAGLQWTSYSGDFPWIPFTDGLEISGTGSVSHPTSNPEADLIIFEGFLDVPVTGEYAFRLEVDGMALLRIHKITLMDAAIGEKSFQVKECRIHLESGLHPFSLSVLSGESHHLELEWQVPESDMRRIPDSRFRSNLPR